MKKVFNILMIAHFILLSIGFAIKNPIGMIYSGFNFLYCAIFYVYLCLKEIPQVKTIINISNPSNTDVAEIIKQINKECLVTKAPAMRGRGF